MTYANINTHRHENGQAQGYKQNIAYLTKKANAVGGHGEFRQELALRVQIEVYGYSQNRLKLPVVRYDIES